MKYTKCDFLSKVWVRPPGWTWCVGSKGQIATLSEHCQVAYQIKDKDYCPIEIIKGLTDKGQFQYLTKLMGPQEGTYLYATQFHSLR